MALPTPIRIGGDSPAGFPGGGRPLPIPSAAEEAWGDTVRAMVALGVVGLSMLVMVRVAQATEGRSTGMFRGV